MMPLSRHRTLKRPMRLVPGSPIVYDNLAWLNSVERIRSFATLRDATIIFGHDPKQIKEIRLAPQAFYD